MTRLDRSSPLVALALVAGLAWTSGPVAGQEGDPAPRVGPARGGLVLHGGVDEAQAARYDMVRLLTSLGCSDVRALHSRDRDLADTAAFAGLGLCTAITVDR